VRVLYESLRIHPAFCEILTQRGIYNFEQAEAFFRPGESQLIDPFLMKDMQLALDRIALAMSRGEHIMFYGDYDVDGTTAVATTFNFFRQLYPQVSFYIPHRYREGYGISEQAIDQAAEQNVQLIISLDCGIKSAVQIAYAATKGIDFIICDHHLPDNDIPKAVAILNPKQSDCPYPFKDLSGCGIGFKLIQAWGMQHNVPHELVFKNIDLVATSIAADIVPITGENRTLTYLGLEKANSNPTPALAILKKISNLDKPFTVSDLVFVIAPRVNAAGRMDDARKAVELFLEEDPARLQALAEALHSDNFDRKAVDKQMTEEALQIMTEDLEQREKSSTVLFRAYWHKGVVGIVASRLMDHFYRPTVILTESNGKIAGSARSVMGFNIYEALHACRDLLETYGGHFYAAGMTMKPELLEEFILKFEEVVSQTIAPEMLTPEIEIDATLPLQAITSRFYHILQQLEPFGPGNMRPVFISRNVTDTGFSKLVKDSHIKFHIYQQTSAPVSGIGFGLGHKYPIVHSGQPFDIVYTLYENDWNGQRSIEMKVLDISPAGSQC